jgi:hypothetical protein
MQNPDLMQLLKEKAEAVQAIAEILVEEKK